MAVGPAQHGSAAPNERRDEDKPYRERHRGSVEEDHDEHRDSAPDGAHLGVDDRRCVGLAGEVEGFHEARCLRVPAGKRGKAVGGFDELQDRGEVRGRVIDKPLLGEG